MRDFRLSFAFLLCENRTHTVNHFVHKIMTLRLSFREVSISFWLWHSGICFYAFRIHRARTFCASLHLTQHIHLADVLALTHSLSPTAAVGRVRCWLFLRCKSIRYTGRTEKNIFFAAPQEKVSHPHSFIHSFIFF